MLKRWLPTLLLLIALGGARAAPLPAAADLQRSLAQAREHHKVLVVLFSLPDCPWCEQARRLSFDDLARGGQPVVQVDMDSSAPLRDFDGRATDGRALARRLRVDLAPTALFVGDRGRELAPRMVGVGTPDFYDALVQQSLARAADSARHAH